MNDQPNTTDHWAVTVERDGQGIVTIEANCLSGREIDKEDERVIRIAAAHLLAFIGDAPPVVRDTTDWRRASAVATYDGFSSYLEISGDRMRFVIDATIERASEVPKLQEFISCMAGILALPDRRCRPTIEVDADWAE